MAAAAPSAASASAVLQLPLSRKKQQTYIDNTARVLMVDAVSRAAWLFVSWTRHDPLPFATDIAHAMLRGDWGIPIPVDVWMELKRRGAQLDEEEMDVLFDVMGKVAPATAVLARAYRDAAGVYARDAYPGLEMMDGRREDANRDLRAMEKSQECLPLPDICRLLERGGNPRTALKYVLATNGPKSRIREAVDLITKGTSDPVEWDATLVPLACQKGHEEVVPKADLRKFRPPERSERKRTRTQKAGLAAAAKAPSERAKKKKRRGSRV